MAPSKNPTVSALDSALSALSASAARPSQDANTGDHPSLHSLLRDTSAQRRPSGVSLPLRETFGRLGVQSGRPLLDILDEALALQSPAPQRSPSIQPSYASGEARQ